LGLDLANRFTRRRLIAGAAPLVAAGPLAKLALADGNDPADHTASGPGHMHASGHAAMIGAETPAAGGPDDLDALLYPPPPLAHRPGRLREYVLTAIDTELEVAPGVFYPAWTYNGTVPGPVIRATEDDLLRVRFVNAGSHPHTIHFHGIHPAAMDGAPGIGEDIGGGLIDVGEEFTYEFDARPFGLHPYHCHASPLAGHIAKGLYGALIVDPPEGRAQADELLMVQNAFDPNFDDDNEVYAVNTVAFHFMYAPVQVKRDELVRIYLVNMVELDPVNSFHIHGNFFNRFPTGTSLTPLEYADTVIQGQGQRDVLEIRFPYTGKYMFHAHKSEFAALGWMGFFEVSE
jgi:FtsP/CotA-like multicopper oxidase with cupredoxin domain